MSWTQGIQLREDIDKKWLSYLDNLSEVGTVASLVWDATEPELLHVMYEDEQGNLINSITFKVKTPKG